MNGPVGCGSGGKSENGFPGARLVGVQSGPCRRVPAIEAHLETPDLQFVFTPASYSAMG